jgi:hypothetical protein
LEIRNVLLSDRAVKPKDFVIPGSNLLGMLINREHGVIWAARRVCVCKDNCWPKIILNGDMNGRDGCINIEYTGELKKFASPRYGRVTAITNQAFRDSIKIGSIFCSPLPDRMIPEQIPEGTRLNNNFIVCYDLVKIWKEPFENPYKLGAKYKVAA